MKKGKFLFLCIIVSALGGTLALLFLWQDAPSRALGGMLSHYSDPSSTPLQYIHPELRDDPFWDVFTGGNVIKGYKIIKSQKYSDNKSRVAVSLLTDYGTIPLDFILENRKNKWQIVQFPKTTIVDGAIPLWIDDDGDYTIDVEGTRISCKLQNSHKMIELSAPISLTLMGDYIVEHTKLQPIALNKIVSACKEYIEDEVLGKINITDPMSVYDISKGSPEYIERELPPIGITHITIFKSYNSPHKSVVAFIDTSHVNYETIRVALNNSDFSSLYHSNIRISSTRGMTINNLVDDLNFSIDKGQEVTFDSHENREISVSVNGQLLGTSSNRWHVVPENLGRIIVNTIERSHSQGLDGTPYRGTMEISWGSEGLVLINEVGLEEYLYTVVPSEMPIKFGLESLKVQAIAARSYAARCFNATGYSALGAHVDDSVSSQVYNNSAEYPPVLKAVDDTQGLIPTYLGDIVDTRFFSTSWGYTANFHETWSIDNEFPSDEIPYLIAKPQFTGDATSLYNEENFKAFINKKEPKAYDRFSPFYRWSVAVKINQIEEIIKESLPRLQKAQPEFVLTRVGNKNYSQRTIPGELGQLLNITPTQRGEGGNLMEIEVSTTSGIYRIQKELNIRQLLRPVNLVPEEDPIIVKRNDGSTVTDFPMLPSSFFYMDIIRNSKGDISHIVFTGGGYGHGVGMSQHGVYGLSLLGKSYQEIIEHFYPGTEIESLY